MNNTTPDHGQVRIRTCFNPSCTNELTYINGQIVDEEFAIELASWLTVQSEIINAEGVQVVTKTFCSTTCLKEYLDMVTAEYTRAEDKVLVKMADTDWEPRGEA